MRKSTKLMAGLGVVAGLGVALAPLATFAVNQSQLEVTVTSSCALTEDQNDDPIVIDDLWKGSGAVDDGTITLTKDSTGSDAHISVLTFACSENSMVTVSAHSNDLENGNLDVIEAAHVKGMYTGAYGMVVRSAFSGQYGVLDNSGSAVIIADGTAQPATGSPAKVPDMTLTVAGYQVVLNEDQVPGTYTGTVDYTWALATN